jgi:hypothetical protein
MSSLADLPEIVGFFSYSREDDEASRGMLSALRDAIQGELSGQLGRSKATFRLWQDQAAIAPGQLWESQIKTAIEQAVFFIPIVTPRALNSHHCKFEFEAFLARERALGRADLVFPLLYIRVSALENEALWRNDLVLSIIGERQYVDWRRFRLRDVHDPAVRTAIADFCEKIVDALRGPWVSPEERRKQEIEAARLAEEKRKVDEAARLADEEKQRAEAVRRAEAARQAEEEQRRAEAARQTQHIARWRWWKIAAVIAPIFIFVGILGVGVYSRLQSETTSEAVRQAELKKQQAEMARRAELQKQQAEAARQEEPQKQPSPDRAPVGAVIDEARQAGRSAQSFPAADEDYFRAMDGGIALTPVEVKGRNMWLVWTGGNDRLWDELTNITFGSFDLLKILSSYPGLKYSRDNRWNYFGLVNEPCFTKATGPNSQRYGLWLDVRGPDCPSDPFENAQKYPGVAVGARGKNIQAGSFYGYPTGVVGLRLFPNPDFDEAAAARWNPERFYIDPNYYTSKDLVRPYRVGVSCGFCHVGPNPEKPPVNPEAPQWENLSSIVGAQYSWVDRIFAWNADPSSFLFQTLHTARPGSLNTSLVSSDNINNPRTMNAIYYLSPRLEAAKRWGHETLGPDNLANTQFNDFINQGPLTQFFQPPNIVLTPHMLKDGADSVGALGALNRIYLNIGLFSEEWLRHFNPILGGKPISPFAIGVARANSSYWQATEMQTPNMALFLVQASYPHKLKNAPGGANYLNDPPDVAQQGKLVFADNCAACHSSKAPVQPAHYNPANCIGPGYLECWDRYWEWTTTDDFRQQMRQIVNASDFLEGNYLSNDMRVPVTLLQTNACSPLATNAIAGNIWDNFSSASYKDLPSVGAITVYDPFTGAPRQYQMPAGGRGYTRVPSLISIWSTAPFLLNNSVGRFDPSPSVEARVASFDDSITKMLWPEKREKDAVLGDKIPGVIDRTTATSWARIPIGYLPDTLRSVQDVLQLIAPKLFNEGGLEIGPIPAGTPVGLLANLELLSPSMSPSERSAHDKAVIKAILTLVHDFKALPQGATFAETWQVFGKDGEQLFALSKCPDYVVNRGHYFGSNLSDRDKQALIAFLKTF